MPVAVPSSIEFDDLSGPDPNRVYYVIGGVPQSRPILKGKEAKATFSAIPEISLADVTSPSLERRQALASRIRDASRDVGFFVATDSPIAPKLIDDAFASLSSFFSLPPTTKQKIFCDHSPAAKGWNHLPAPSGAGFRRESFGLGTDYMDPEQHFVALPREGSVRKNLWLDETPELRRALYAYYREVFAFAQSLVKIFALVCGLPEDGLDGYFERPLTDITVQCYPEMENLEEPVVTTPAHADYCLFTLLLQNNQAGLEVLNHNGIWIPVRPLAYDYVINIGNYLEVLSNGYFTSTVHRVISHTGAPRTSVPFFHSPSPDVTLRPLAHFVPEGEAPRYEPYAIGARQLKGMMSLKLDHPFVRAMQARGLKEEDYDYELLSRPVEEYVASK